MNSKESTIQILRKLKLIKSMRHKLTKRMEDKKMNIAKCNLDKRGRLTIPLSFFKANSMHPEEYNAVVQVVMNNLNTVKIVFSKKGEA